MVNPDQAWNATKLSLWSGIALELADIKETNPDRALGRAFHTSFKIGVKKANRAFSEELKPENRQN